MTDSNKSEWVLVPREPSGVMSLEGNRLRYSGAANYVATDIYRAMLEVAPSPPSNEELREAVARALREHIKCDATGLQPAIASVFLVGFEEATAAALALVSSRLADAEARLARAEEAMKTAQRQLATGWALFEQSGKHRNGAGYLTDAAMWFDVAIRGLDTALPKTETGE